MRRFTTRSLPKPSLRLVLLAGLGAVIAIASLRLMAEHAGMPLLMAPFGASCVLLFAVPASPLSQPVNVIAGHAVATLVGLVLRQALPDQWWSLALAVGLAVALMAALRVTHPPAGADPLVVFAANPDFLFLIFPVISGAVLLVALATFFHRLSGTAYPQHPQ